MDYTIACACDVTNGRDRFAEQGDVMGGLKPKSQAELEEFSARAYQVNMAFAHAAMEAAAEGITAKEMAVMANLRWRQMRPTGREGLPMTSDEILDRWQEIAVANPAMTVSKIDSAVARSFQISRPAVYARRQNAEWVGAYIKREMVRWRTPNDQPDSATGAE